MSQPLSLSETPVSPSQKSVINSAAALDKREQQNKQPLSVSKSVITQPLTVQSPKDSKSVTTQPVTDLSPKDLKSVTTKPLTVPTESLDTVLTNIRELSELQQKFVDAILGNSASELAKLKSELAKLKSEADKQKSKTVSSEENNAQVISTIIKTINEQKKKLGETIQTVAQNKTAPTAAAAAEKYYKYKQKYLQLKNNTL